MAVVEHYWLLVKLSGYQLQLHLSLGFVDKVYSSLAHAQSTIVIAPFEGC